MARVLAGIALVIALPMKSSVLKITVCPPPFLEICITALALHSKAALAAYLTLGVEIGQLGKWPFPLFGQ